MKVGIITMHKVINYGSILQAYALQEKLRQLGYDNEIIDYQFPPKVKVGKVTYLLRLLYSVVVNLLSFGALATKRSRFEKFHQTMLRTSKFSYNYESIHSNPPRYDLYITGSDQVWNPSFAGSDTSFLLSFVPKNSKCISYASSFAINEIPADFKELYAKELLKYQSISVREQSGLRIVKELINRDAKVVCDPTLLLKREDWDKLANQSKIKVDEPYILVYVLTYMYNPYPEIENLINKVQKELGNIKVIILEGRKQDVFRKNSRVIKDAGPNEFVYLFKKASFVITISFHGTAFSLIYGKPVYGVVKDVRSNDGRIISTLKKVDMSSSIIDYKDVDVVSKEQVSSLCCKEQDLQAFRDYSIGVLHEMLL